MPVFRQFLFFLCGLYALIQLSACDRPSDFEARGPLEFTNDSIIFDTLFTTIQSPAERFYFYNKSGGNMLIDEIRISGGDNSPFQMVVDGRKGNVLTKFELAKNDSLIGFFTLKATTENGDRTVIDFLECKVGDKIYRLPIVARLLDAYIFRDTVIDCNNFKFPNDKPVVVDGYIYVPPACTLSIPGGAKLYFTAKRTPNFDFYSRLFVRGTLKVNEEDGPEVLMTSLRLEENYKEQAGQWFGIIIADSSQGSLINRTIIKNSSYGIYVDSISTDNQPKVKIRNTEIRNIANFGIFGVGKDDYRKSNQPMILGHNIVISRCGQSCVGMLWGGSYEFAHCTFDNDKEVTFNRSQPTFGYNNYQRDPNNATIIRKVFPGRLILENSIIWGTNDNEFALDTVTNVSNLNAISVSNNLIRSQIKTDDFQKVGKNNILNLDPKFKDYGKRNYEISEKSPAIKAGLDLNMLKIDLRVDEINLDFKKRPRPNNQPDIGAYQMVP